MVKEEKKQKPFYFKKSQILLGLAGVILSLTTLMFFKYEKWILEPRITSKLNREKAGSVLSHKNKIKRRYVGSMTFFDIGSGDKVIVGDTIFTEQNSLLEIKLETGSRIVINEYTMLIIDKDKDNFKIYMSTGDITGELAKNDKIIFDVDHENVEIKGDEGAQFTVKSVNWSNKSFSSLSGKVFASFKSKSYDLSKEKLELPKDPFKKENAPDKEDFNPNDLVNSKPEQTAAPLPTALVKMDDIPADIPFPYPPDKHLFLINKDVELILYPKRICTNDCEIKLKVFSMVINSWKFKKGEMPLVKIVLGLKNTSIYELQLQDGNQKLQIHFDVEGFSKGAFERALQEGYSVEVMN